MKIKLLAAQLLGPLLLTNGCGSLLPVFASEPPPSFSLNAATPSSGGGLSFPKTVSITNSLHITSTPISGASADNTLRRVVATNDESTLRVLAAALQSQRMNLNVIANNLANVNTTAFKMSQIHFQDSTCDQANQASLKQGATPAYITRVLTQGDLSKTGNNFDIAIQGVGFFEVQLPDGSKGYTRDGGFQINRQGRVVTSEGCPVMGGFQPVPQGVTDVTITASGAVSYTGASGMVLTSQAQIARFVNPGGLDAAGYNLFKPTEASGERELGTPGENGFGELQQGFLELSNVSVEAEGVNLFLAERAYETTSKAMQVAEKILQ